MTEINKIALPDEYKDKAWTKAIVDEEGNVDINKTLNKIAGQESLLGKKVVPGKDASDDEWREFNGKVTKDYIDSDYESVLDGTESKSQAIAKLKENGLAPRQAKVVAELMIAEREIAVGKKYDAAAFQEAIVKAVPDEKDRIRAKNILEKSGAWADVESASNDGAIAAIVAAAKVGKTYDIDDLPGKIGGEPNQTQGNGKGYCQEYVNRCYELSKTMSKQDATKQAKAEFSIVE